MNTKGIFHFTCCQGASTGPFCTQKNPLKINVQFCIFIVIYLEIKFYTERWCVFSDFILFKYMSL
jgi:hypothetical protein